MQVSLKGGATGQLVEILGSRVTIKKPNGRYVDAQLRDVTSFDGKVTFAEDGGEEGNATYRSFPAPEEGEEGQNEEAAAETPAPRRRRTKAEIEAEKADAARDAAALNPTE